jgi:hypothetical protein
MTSHRVVAEAGVAMTVSESEIVMIAITTEIAIMIGVAADPNREAADHRLPAVER